MIQRIQSIFLFLVALISLLLVFLPFEQYSNGENTISLSLSPFSKPEGVANLIFAPVFINLALGILAIITIFQYKKRTKQLKIARGLMFTSLFMITSLLSIDFFHDDKAVWTKTYLWPSFLPIASVVFAFLAARSIKKDEELVRSADRIR